MDLIAELAGTVGPRTAGSREAQRSADLVAEAFRELALEPTFQEFEFVGYEPEQPALRVDGVAVPAGPCIYSHPTPPEGVRGMLRYLGRHVVLKDLFEPLAFSIEEGGT